MKQGKGVKRFRIFMMSFMDNYIRTNTSTIKLMRLLGLTK